EAYPVNILLLERLILRWQASMIGLADPKPESRIRGECFGYKTKLNIELWMALFSKDRNFDRE
ncbi:MAG: hypothetical protein K2M22_05915, partial [Lachnospiraceae bacterium]|nr:hypothetical protein [Lachnospiraceae bacterium]